ncbi:MAG TPA: hypothetical protein VEO95_03380 [Chthoniobacteraceae bacterium]|nr:hypothetical protein [Chthoniobacteraceae bacterium]
MTFRRQPALQTMTGLALLASVLFVLVLAANPALHERLHHHHDHGGQRDDHDQHDGKCVVNLFASGSVDAAAAPPLLGIFFVVATPAPAALSHKEIRSPFLTGSILEHAPPARG